MTVARYSHQLVSGIWNPAERNYSWVIVEEFDTIKEAREALDELIAERIGLGRMERVENEHRTAYSGPPLAIIRVQSKVAERWGQEEPVTEAA